MNVRSIRRRVSAVAFVAAVLVACGGEMGGAGLPGGGVANALDNAACPELRGGAMNANFEADAKANGTIRAFVSAAGELSATAAEAERDVLTACEKIGADLGIPAEQMAPKQGQHKVEAACDAVSAKIEAIMHAGASAHIKASYTPPECKVQGEAETSCKAQCGINVDPGYVKAHCEPGHLAGKCEAACSGTCDGTCNGECHGECEGQAKAHAAPGTAAGNAAAKCDGHCHGTCKGSCSADCHGTCSVDFKEPRCEVAMKGPSADAHCEGSCHAHAELTAQCTEAKVNVTSSVNTGESEKLAATLRAHLPLLIKAEIGLGKRVLGNAEVLVQTGRELPSAFGHLTAHAGACVTAAASEVVSAHASLSVSVHASASVSGKAGAHAGG